MVGALGPTLGPLAIAANQKILSFAGARCRNLDTDSYGVVDVDATAGTAKVTLKRSDGQIVADQVDPSVSCARTIGP